MIRRRELLALGGSALAVRAAFGQAKYPERPIRLIVPFPPGGAFDSIGRPWADKMQSLLGTVVVENQGGGGSSLGAAAVARAPPDGYTLLLGGIGALVIHPLAATRPLFDPLRDFEPISVMIRNIFGLVVHPSLPVRTLKELIEHARQSPGKLSYGSAGVGSGNHLAGELLKSLTGAEIVHIPYRGAAPALADLIAGQIPMAVPAVSGQVLELDRSGKLRLLAVTSQVRLIAAPDIPTAVEAGLPDMVAEAFVGLFAPGGTPRPIVEQIAQATRTAMADPELRQKYIGLGLEPYPEAIAEQPRRLVESELTRWAPLIKSIGLKLN